MRKFLQEKYPLIYEEYKEFYNTLNRNHPYTRNLTNTCTFQSWSMALKQQSTSNILSTALKEALTQEQTEIHADQDQESSCQTSDQSDKDNDQDVDAVPIGGGSQ